MSLERKINRKNKHKTRCCGEQMLYKPDYEAYVCPICGNVKIFKKDK